MIDSVAQVMNSIPVTHEKCQKTAPAHKRVAYRPIWPETFEYRVSTRIVKRSCRVYETRADVRRGMATAQAVNAIHSASVRVDNCSICTTTALQNTNAPLMANRSSM